MKLDLESPLVQDQNLPEIQEADLGKNGHLNEMLKAGIKAAQEGNRTEARQMLFCVTESQPDNETAWLWLASISEYPEELLGFLDNVLRINPENQRALKWTKATKSLIAKTLVQRGITASHDNQIEFARQFFRHALNHDQENEPAWLWLASISDSAEEKTSYLEKVLALNPNNETAQNSLKALAHQNSQALLKKAGTEAIAGNHEEARAILEEVMKTSSDVEEAWILKAYLSNSYDEKILCFQEVLNINPENETAQSGIDSLNAIRQKELEALLQKSSLKKGKSKEEKAKVEAQAQETAQPTQTVETEPSAEEVSAAEIETAASQDEEFSERITQELDEDFPTAQTQEMSNSDTEEISDVAPVAAETASEVLHAEEFENFQAEQAAENFVESAQVVDFAEENVLETESVSVFEDAAQTDYTDTTDDELLEEISFAEVQTTTDFTENLVEENEFTQEVSPTENPVPTVAPEKAFFTENHLTETQMSETHFTEPATFDFETVETHSSETDFAEAETSENSVSSKSVHNQPESFPCPYCYAVNESQSFNCYSCGAVLTLSDLEVLLNNTEADQNLLKDAVEKLEAQAEVHQLSEEELTRLGIAYLNLKEFRQGFTYLNDAAQMNPNNVIFTSQVHSLAIRLAEIEEHNQKVSEQPQKTILVVDDSATVRKLISGKLEKCGHTVVLAVDGMDALAKMSEVTPDLVLLDITMPRLDGYQVCKLIRNNDVTKDVPVVMISGKDGFFDKVRGKMAGSTGYITKPFGPDTLMRTVETFFNQPEA